MKILRAIMAVLIAILLIPVGSGAQAARKQVYSWQWADGSIAAERTFTSAEYANRVDEIAVLVGVRPAFPRHKVRLEVYQQGKWYVHARARTNARTGRARLALNPICKSGAWCKGTFSLRLRVLRKGVQRPATLPLTVTFDPGTPSSPITPPPSKPRVSSTLGSPMVFQVAENLTLGPPTITAATAVQNPDKHSEVVVNLTWDAPVSYADNPVAGYYVLMDEDLTKQTWDENSWYVQYAPDERDVSIRGPIIYADNPAHGIDLTVVAVDTRGDFGQPATTIQLQIGCDVYGPATGAENPYRTLCEHGL